MSWATGRVRRQSSMPYPAFHRPAGAFRGAARHGQRDQHRHGERLHQQVQYVDELVRMGADNSGRQTVIRGVPKLTGSGWWRRSQGGRRWCWRRSWRMASVIDEIEHGPGYTAWWRPTALGADVRIEEGLELAVSAEERRDIMGQAFCPEGPGGGRLPDPYGYSESTSQPRSRSQPLRCCSWLLWRGVLNPRTFWLNAWKW